MRTRLLAIGILAVLSLLLILEVPFAVVLSHYEQAQLANVETAFAAEIAPAFAVPVRARLRATLRQEATQYSSRERVILVFDRQGALVAEGRSGHAQLSMIDRTRVHRTAMGQRVGGAKRPVLPSDAIVVMAPVRAGEETVGAVVIVRDVSALHARILRRWTMLGVLGMAIVGAAAAIAVPLTGWILRPLTELSAAIRRVGEGASPVRLNASAGPPELRSVALQFNDMADSVKMAMERQRSFIADASHQLRNPLTALRLRVENLAHHLRPSGEETLERALSDVDRISVLASQLLLLVRSEGLTTNLSETTITTINVSELVELRSEDWRAMLRSGPRSGVFVMVDSGTAIEAIARTGVLEQVLDVLVDNAVKFSPDRAAVRVVVSTKGPFAEVRVIDEGPGMTADERSRATDRFWRGPQTQHLPGSGLGLSIANLLITSCGGSLDLQSRAEGGLEARVRLAPPPGVTGPSGTATAVDAGSGD